MIENAHLYCGDAMDFYDQWATPMTIVSDGAYGIDGFDGDLKTHERLADWAGRSRRCGSSTRRLAGLMCIPFSGNMAGSTSAAVSGTRE